MSDEKIKLGSHEVLRVMPNGEFIWHEEADQMIEDGDFTNSPALPHMLRKLRAAEKQLPILKDIEQYRMQMAGICTAAIGYWKEGDGIHPDYDTLALRDVAKLYEKYDALYKTQPVPHAVIADALFDFMGWLTSRKERIVLSSADEASPAVDAIRDFAKMRGLSLDDAQVREWIDSIKENT